MIALNGATNAERYLNFYEQYYENVDRTPYVKILLDDDEAGRKVFPNISENRYKNIKLEKIKVKNYVGKEFVGKEKVNIEIEDLMYPEVIIDIVNSILSKKGFNLIDDKQTCKKIKSSAFMGNGILALCENEKNNVNLENGNEILINSNSAGFKKNMAEQFNVEANLKMINMLKKCDTQYPFVRTFITELMNYDKSDTQK